jgi:hypothetical protein
MPLKADMEDPSLVEMCKMPYETDVQRASQVESAKSLSGRTWMMLAS